MANPTKTKAEADREYYVLDQAQLECMASAVRQNMVDQLAAHGDLSMKELAVLIGRKPASIYHHLNKLLEVGLVCEAGSRVINRKVEKLYATPSRRMRLARALEEANHDESMEEIVRALCRQTDRDFTRGLTHEGAKRRGAKRNLRFFRLVSRVSPKRLAEINAKLDEIAELLWEDPDSDETAVALTWVLAPVGDEE